MNRYEGFELDVAVFTKLEKLELDSMALDGKIGSKRTERPCMFC